MLRNRASIALLARLGLRPEQDHPRESLIDQLWPDAPLDVGRNRLRQVLSTLRATLEPTGTAPVLRAERRSVGLVPGTLECDAQRFERLASLGDTPQAQAQTRAQALSLYRGELLPGLYDAWIDDERARLAAVAERLAGLLASSPRLAAPARRDPLPRYLTRLVGAHTGMAKLRAALAEHRLVNLVGPGGCGKTRLAVELAHSALDTDQAGPAGPALPRFEGVDFVPLAHCRSQADMLDALLLALGLAPASADAAGAIDALVDALAQRRWLVVLDNFEQLVEPGAALLGRLAARLPQVHWLVTSRRVLGLDGERVCMLSPLALPAPDAPLGSLADLARNPALALFLDRARAVRSDFALDAGQPGASLAEVVALLHALGGLPLAIELAAARMRSLSPAQILGDRAAPSGSAALVLLARTGTRAAHDLRHASMQQVLDWSWSLLPAPAQRLLSGLSVFGGGFSAAAALAVCADEPALRQGPVLLLLLDELVGHSLLQAGDESGQFHLAELVREYAATRQDAARALSLRAHHRRWLLAWACGLPASPALRPVRATLPDLVQAWASALADNAASDAVALFNAAQGALSDISLPPGALAALVQCAQALPASPARAVGQANLARALFRAGDAGLALRLADAAVASVACVELTPSAAVHGDLAPARVALPPALRALVLARVAHVRWRVCADPRAADWLTQALAIAQAAHLPGLAASVLATQGAMARRSDPALALALQRQSIAAWTAAGDSHGVITGRHNLALALAAQPAALQPGARLAALDQLQRMLADAHAAEDWAQVGFGCNLRGDVLCALRRWADAADAYRESVRVSHAMREPLPLAYSLWNLPTALAHLRQGPTAARLMGFAAAFWVQRFGALTPADARDVLRVERLVAAQAGRATMLDWLAQGRSLGLAQAVTLALASDEADARASG